MYEDSLNTLLQTVMVDLKQYEDAKRKSGAVFNVFEVTGINRKEVAMCAFLAELLKPCGQHGMGILFLKSFCIDVLTIDGFRDADYLKAKVETEVVIDNDRRIDIMLRINNRLFPIEVKIFAEDQDTQCSDYYRYTVQYDPKSILFYLTLDGHEPSEKSKQALNEGQYRCISFSFDVLDWVTDLTEKAEIKQSANMLSVLSQFEDTLEHLTSRQERNVTAMMKKLISSKESFHAADMIEKSLPAIKADMMIRFFSAVQEKLKVFEADFPVALADYTQKAIDYYCNNKTSIEPSLNYVLPAFDDSLETQETILRIVVNWNLWFGICSWDKAIRTDPQFSHNEIISILSKRFGNDEPSKPIWWKYLVGLHGKMDFKNCNESIEELFDENQFQKTVDLVCGEIEAVFAFMKEEKTNCNDWKQMK